jgi:hypothetical protein
MSITAIAHQAQGIRAGEVIAKLAEDAYFMRVDNRVNQPLPARKHNNEATSRSAGNGPNRTRAELPAEPNRHRSTAGGPPQRDNGNCEVVPHRAPAGGGGSDGGSSNHGANRRAGGGSSRGGRGNSNSHASGASQGVYDARQKIEELRRKKSTTVGDGDGFPAFSPRLRNLLLPDKFKPLGITSTTRSRTPFSGSGATPSPLRTLAATMTPSASTSPSAWTKLHSHGSSRWTSTRTTSGTS